VQIIRCYPLLPQQNHCSSQNTANVDIALLDTSSNIRHCDEPINSSLDVCGSVHCSIIHKENPTRSNSVSKFYSIFIWSSTCFGQHAAHHQEPKTALAASGFAYVESCWMCSCWTLTAHVQQLFTYAKPEAASAVLGSWWWAVCHPKHVELHINMK